MSSPETYVTKKNPTVEDWMDYNEDLFAALRAGASVEEGVDYAPLTDFDEHANRAGIDTEEYLKWLKNKVGPLGAAALYLVHSKMDDALHVVIG